MFNIFDINILKITIKVWTKSIELGSKLKAKDSPII